jgi:sterol desaturase/sphingolipid hydroxylase (fatty acid hydroxylase superfamily)
MWGQHGWRGFWTGVLLHMGPTEFVYYWAHRLLHHHTLYSKYHSHHHASFVTQPWSGTCHPFLEHVLYMLILTIPLGTCAQTPSHRQ